MKLKIFHFLFFGGLALLAIGWFLPGKVIPHYDRFSGAEVINGFTIIGALMSGSAILLAIISGGIDEGGSPRKNKRKLDNGRSYTGTNPQIMHWHRGYDPDASEPIMEYTNELCCICNSDDCLYRYQTSYGKKVVLCLDHEHAREDMTCKDFDRLLQLMDKAQEAYGKNDKEYVWCILKIIKHKGFDNYWGNWIGSGKYKAIAEEIKAEQCN